MKQEGVMLSEINQAEKDKYCMVLYVQSEIAEFQETVEWWLLGWEAGEMGKYRSKNKVSVIKFTKVLGI